MNPKQAELPGTNKSNKRRPRGFRIRGRFTFPETPKMRREANWHNLREMSRIACAILEGEDPEEIDYDYQPLLPGFDDV